MKALKTWTIVTLIFSILALALVTVCLYRPVAFGEWMVVTYEDITCELGHTAEGAYDILTNVSIISFSVLFIINQILHFCKKTESDVEKTETNTVKEESTVLKRVKNEKKEKIKKARKEKVKKIAKKVVDEVVEEVTETKVPETKVESPVTTSNSLANFLDSFR